MEAKKHDWNTPYQSLEKKIFQTKLKLVSPVSFHIFFFPKVLWADIPSLLRTVFLSSFPSDTSTRKREKPTWEREKEDKRERENRRALGRTVWKERRKKTAVSLHRRAHWERIKKRWWLLCWLLLRSVFLGKNSSALFSCVACEQRVLRLLTSTRHGAVIFAWREKNNSCVEITRLRNNKVSCVCIEWKRFWSETVHFSFGEEYKSLHSFPTEKEK